jgi:hypothetical protein
MSDSSSALSSPGSSHSLPLTDGRSLSSAPSSDGPTAPDTGAAGNDDDDGDHLSPSVVDACAAVVLSSSSSVSSRSAYRPAPGQSDAVRPLPLLSCSPGPPASLTTDDRRCLPPTLSGSSRSRPSSPSHRKRASSPQARAASVVIAAFSSPGRRPLRPSSDGRQPRSRPPPPPPLLARQAGR